MAKGNNAANAIRAKEAAKYAADILDDPEYRRNIKARAVAGLLPAGMETMLWYYRYGKPVERVEITDLGKVDFTEMTTEEMHNRAASITEALRLEAIEEAKRQLEAAQTAAREATGDDSMFRGIGDRIDDPTVH